MGGAPAPRVTSVACAFSAGALGPLTRLAPSRPSGPGSGSDPEDPGVSCGFSLSYCFTAQQL